MGLYFNEPEQPAQACVIWLHGLGADAQNMMGVVDALPTERPIRHVFVDAPVRPVTLNNNMPMRAWYNIVGMKLTDREDRDGILQSEKMIQDVIASQLADGFTSKQIHLAGFSQGGAMALFIGLRSSVPLGGIIALSAYLPLVAECVNAGVDTTPIWMAMGEHDPVVLPSWTRQSFDWLISQKFKHTSLKSYPMEHMICLEEIRDLSSWLSDQISLITCDGDI
ncbi:MAG: alpha/beta hydrolase [Legionellaceae bacterium]|nr:alpha/beta hydrolase [Legionellaceae bacterium]